MASTSVPQGARTVQTHYEILEISPAASQQEIKDAYKRLAFLKHPDKNLGDIARACAAFQQLQTAYEILAEPTLRAKYDARILRAKKAAPHSKPSPAPPPATSPPPAQERPTPPERPRSPKLHFPNVPLPMNSDDARPPWLSRAWYEISIEHSVIKEKLYRQEMAALADLNDWRRWSHVYDRVQFERNFQEELKTELRVMMDRVFGAA